MDGKATETGGVRYSRENLLDMRKAFTQGMVVQAMHFKETFEALDAPQDFAGVEKAAKAMSALNKAGCEAFASALDEPKDVKPAEPAEKEDMNDDGEPRLASGEPDWRVLLKRQLAVLNERKSAGRSDEQRASEPAKDAVSSGAEPGGARGPEPAIRRLA